MSEGAVKTAVHRLRRRLGQLLREETVETVSRPEEVDAELKHFLGTLTPWTRPPSEVIRL